MQSISKFDVNVYSEEMMAGVSESDYDEVMRASAVEGEDFEGYAEWSEQVEFETSLEARATVETDRGPMLIKRECDHKDCSFTCKRDQRIGGISI